MTFVIHEHHARRFHLDLRLEWMEGDMVYLRSWAIPKAHIPEREKLLAVETEPHDMEYRDFEGVIPEGQYGAGEVKMYDKGELKYIEVSENKIVFELKGKKVKGRFALIKFKTGKDWLWMRTKSG